MGAFKVAATAANPATDCGHSTALARKIRSVTGNPRPTHYSAAPDDKIVLFHVGMPDIMSLNWVSIYEIDLTSIDT